MRLELENFRGVRKGVVELGNLNILVGGNNSGKTTILESLFIAPNPLRDVLNMPAVSILESLHSTLDSRGYAFIFHNYTSDSARISCSDGSKVEARFQKVGDNIEVYIVEDNDAYCLGTLSASEGTISRWEALEKAHMTEDGGLKRSGSMVIDAKTRYFVSKAMGETIYFHPLLIKNALEYFRYHWIEFRNLGLTTKIAKRVSKGVAGGYDDLLLEPFIGGRQTIYMRMADGRGVRLGDLGSGVQVLTTMMLLYEFVKPKMLLVDDLESHMNPSLLMHVASWFGEVLQERTKLVISTHSLEVAKFIAGSLEDYGPKITLVALRDGVMSSRSFSVEEVEELERAGVDIRMGEWVLL